MFFPVRQNAISTLVSNGYSIIFISVITKDLASRKLADGPYSEECALCYNCGCAMRRASGAACLGMSGV